MIDMKRAMFISLAFHLILLGIGYIVYYEIIPEQLIRQVEILDFRMERMPASRVTDYQPVRTEPAINSFNEGQNRNQVPSRVELPKSHNVFDDPLERIVQRRDMPALPTTLDERVGNTLDKVDGSISQDELDLAAVKVQEQPMSVTGDDYLQYLSSMIGESSDSASSYYLEGEILQRTILNEVVPEYPEGLQRNAAVVIQFNVYPDGRVADMMIVKKAEPILEELSMNSLSKWSFNPIPQNTVQKGQITFIYQLK